MKTAKLDRKMQRALKLFMDASAAHEALDRHARRYGGKSKIARRALRDRRDIEDMGPVDIGPIYG